MYARGGPLSKSLGSALIADFYQGPAGPSGFSTAESSQLLYPYTAVSGYDAAAALADSFGNLNLNAAVGPSTSQLLQTQYPQGPQYQSWNNRQGRREYFGAPSKGSRRLTPTKSQNWREHKGRSDDWREHKGRDTKQRQHLQAVRRTVYICDIDPQVTEAALAEVFQECGQIVDCRICGDPHTAMRFAFIEFAQELSMQRAIKLTGTMIGAYPLRVRPSKTAIVPVNRAYLPRNDTERALCSRTVYAANIDKKIDAPQIKQFFQSLCGAVSRLRLLGDAHHTTRIAFVEFFECDSAAIALTCSGALLGALPIRIAPSKTPVRGSAEM